MEEDFRVRILDEQVSRKIAAGEVIDRPAAVARELLDNAIDAGADTIELLIEGGGRAKTELNDNGRGMDKEDLLLCPLAHATSKIRSADDLLRVRSLGFRGEALSSIAAVSRLEIISSHEGEQAWKIHCGGQPSASDGNSGSPTAGSEIHVEPWRRAQGTTVRVSGLFDFFPARKKFLKRDAAEGTLVKNIFIDKALAFPQLSFRFIQDGELKIFLAPEKNYARRFADALLQGSDFIHELYAEGEGFRLSIVVGGPELYRNDRRQQYVFANGRRIQDYGLLQAFEYGCDGCFPNASHPVGAIFLDIDPALADFNIHPAKKEARFQDPASIHRAITRSLSAFMASLGVKKQMPTSSRQHDFDSQSFSPRPQASSSEQYHNRGHYNTETSYSSSSSQPYQSKPAQEDGAQLAMRALLDQRPSFRPLPGYSAESAAPDFSSNTSTESITQRQEALGNLCLVGRAFDLFLVVEKGQSLYFIDQHAAHERMLYDRFKEKPPASQELLVPWPFTTDSDEDDAFLREKQKELHALGIGLEELGDGRWNITALPDALQDADKDCVASILALKEAKEELGKNWLASMACKAAIKEGMWLDDQAALELADYVLSLHAPRCPHGRPVYARIEQKELLDTVRRTH